MKRGRGANLCPSSSLKYPCDRANGAGHAASGQRLRPHGQEFLPAVDVYRQTQQDMVKLQETLRDRIVTDGMQKIGQGSKVIAE